jgi:hypothetical protein
VSGTTSLLDKAIISGLIVAFARLDGRDSEVADLKSLYDELSETVGTSRTVRLWIAAYDASVSTQPLEAA